MCGPHASLCSSAASHPTYGPSHPDPASGSFKQNRISSVSERLFSFSLSYLIRKAEYDFYATLALRSPKGVVRPGRWSREVMLSFFPLLNYNGCPITCHHKHTILCPYGAVLE